MKIFEPDTGDFGYARVSSDEQSKGHSIETQVERLRLAGCTRIYTDVESAFKRGVTRPEFEEMLRFILSGAAKGRKLVVCDLDRLARNEATAFLLFDQLDDSDVGLLSLDQPYLDLCNPDGRVMAGHSVLQARAYSARLSKRVKQGHQRHRDKNLPYFAPFGYRKRDDKFELDTEPFLCLLDDRSEWSRAQIGRWLIETFSKEESLRGTLKTFNSTFGIYSHAIKGKGNRQPRGKMHFGAASLTTWYNNPILRGHIAYGRGGQQRLRHQHLWDIRYDTHPEHRLMSEGEYKTIVDALTYNAKHKGWKAPKYVHPVSGLVYCAACKGLCFLLSYKLRTDPSNIKFSYQCKNWRTRSCDQKQTVKALKIEDFIVERLCSRAEEIATIAATSIDAVELPEILELRRQLMALDSAGNHPAIERAKAELRLQIKQLEKQSEKQELIERTDRALLLSVFSEHDYWRQLQPEEKKRIYRGLVDRVYIRGGQIEGIELKV
ncbi:recombinase family protein [Pantanalinema sp. GBBB05]|uniref:recombinase family protein n=1 Tax=Pantanalinema sp. GBBB05 TaxID=2604139 RepID=UPI001D3A2A09|nr:hypothetical protein [Pantanalinema sp. GBBB05]